jgi:6-phosphogluconolactonase (cycloisomerase 2 family)
MRIQGLCVVVGLAVAALAAPAVAGAKKPPPTAPGPGLLPIGSHTLSGSIAFSAGGLAVNPTGDSLYAGAALVDIFSRAPDGSLTPAGGASAPTGSPTSVAAGDGSVYTDAPDDASVVGYARGGDGSLTFAGCVSSPPTSPPCGSSAPGVGRFLGLELSPGGDSLYTASSQGVDAITQFSAGPGGGLSPVTCISDNDSGTGSCPQRVDGLGGANHVAVSPDGSSVYALATNDNALVHFSRAADGSLSYVGCIEDNDSGPDDCAQSTDGLGFPLAAPAVSPDGRSVYTVSFGDEAVVRFDRAPDGSLTPAGCATHQKGADTCSIVSDVSLNNPVSLAVTNASVFVAANASDQIVRFARAPDGSLTPGGCAGEPSGGGFGGGTPCAVSAEGLAGVDELVASPDGTSLYAGNDSRLLSFRIDEIGPETKVKGPKRTSSSRPTFKLKSSEPGSTFLCGVDKKKPKPCKAKFKPRLGDGKHKIVVIAVDAAGNPDPSPAKKKVTVVG